MEKANVIRIWDSDTFNELKRIKRENNLKRMEDVIIYLLDSRDNAVEQIIKKIMGEQYE